MTVRNGQGRRGVGRTRPGGSAVPLSEAYDTALLDLDGVVYAGGEAVPHAVEALGAARAGGMHLAYVTNNALRAPDAVAEHLTELGVPAEAGDVITSAQAVARLIADDVPPGSRVLVIGGEGLRVALRERGLVPVDSAEDGPVAVVQGYGGPEMPWGRFAEASYAVARGLPWYASNTDLTIPGARGIGPGNGAAVEVVRIATGGRVEPKVAGKPLPPMHRETVLRTGAKRPLVVGDRLDTDIEGAFNGGVDSLLVFTGVTDAAQLLAAVPEHRPTYVAADLRGLLVGQPEVVAGEGGVFVCGAWRASVSAPDGGELVLEGPAGDAAGADPMDGVRALCGAAWSAADAAGGAVPDGGKVLARLGF
ncbi:MULTISPECIES: HAD hydrolase-like protein [Streptomyces]|uniref:4-nitrophenylphosphatase n=4 Tax=Streptomyces venezuelae TaxID=54571 RepID=F2RFD1_STRVP|nr:HAD hydrolase-like protein [Streptomyces venezuelae]APE20779.1 HAD family hydrolase [Streptomyces venezuelae]QER98169.1 HAD family hydrolase [Streptomyces venezuelae ATCC 10712]CCA54711.1 4-nitrophenylphosphatase [Streptomyces venezuelae ATCC 10712]